MLRNIKIFSKYYIFTIALRVENLFFTVSIALLIRVRSDNAYIKTQYKHSLILYFKKTFI
jgi:hypothetical protein